MQRQLLTFALFIGIFSALVIGVHYYLWVRLIRAPGLDPTWYRTGTWVLRILALLIPLSLVGRQLIPKAIANIISTVAYTWLGFAILLFFLLLASEVVRYGTQLVASLAHQPLDEDRRQFLSRTVAATTGVMALGLGAVGCASALGEVKVRPVRIRLSRLPEAMSGFRMVQLTDLHIGPMLGRDWLAGIVARTNALNPDLIVITGDLVDGSVNALREHTAPLADLRAKYGVYFVTGNHEYYSGVDEWLLELDRLDVRVLRNERVSIGEGDSSFDLAGVDDVSAGRFGGGHGADLDRALAGRDDSRELVLLAHQPKQIYEAAAKGVGLQVSGHTHGGQIFPWGLFVRLDQPYVAGLSRHGDTQIYVSHGTGYWGPPMRVGAPPEITLLELERTGQA